MLGIDLPALTGPGLELVYAASWFMGNSFPGTMISGAGGRYPRALCGDFARATSLPRSLSGGQVSEDAFTPATHQVLLPPPSAFLRQRENRRRV
jgi:hypothetical protein